MTDADRVAFVRAFLALSEAFSEPITDLKTEAYFDALSDLEIADVLPAMRDAVRECKFFPRPVEIRDRITGTPEDRAEIAWQAVLSLVRSVGWYQKPDGRWPDAAAQRAALELFGGWKALCEHLPSGGPELLGYRKAFVGAYVAYAHRDGLEPTWLLGPSQEEARELLGAIQSQPKTLPPAPEVAQTIVTRKRTEHGETNSLEQIAAWRESQESV